MWVLIDEGELKSLNLIQIISSKFGPVINEITTLFYWMKIYKY